MTNTPHEVPDLWPCPFCGGEAKHTNGWINTDWVSCRDCGASTCMHETKEDAITAWNTRADLVQQDDDDFCPATAGDDPIWLGGVEYITRQRSDDLVQAAVAVREAQKAYFKDRSRDNLIASKQAEAALDKMLAAIRKGGE